MSQKKSSHEWPLVLFVDDLRRVLRYRDDSSVRRALHRGDLGPFLKVGRRLAVMRDTLITALEARSALPKQPRASARRDGLDKYRDQLAGGRGRRRQRRAS